MTEKDCPRCGRVRKPSEEAGRLFIWPPLGHTRVKLVSALKEAGTVVTDEPDQGLVVLDIAADGHKAVAERLSAALTRAEAHDSRALFVSGAGEPTVADLGRVESVETVIARGLGGWLLEVMAAERVTTHFQPIWHAAEPTRLFAHECLLRGIAPDGALLSPGRMFDVATRADLIFPLDRLARTTAVRTAAARRAAGHIFINFTPSSVYDPRNCLRTTLAEVEKTDLTRDRIVFEVIETEQISDPDHLAHVLRYYRDAGFKVALDDLGGGYASLGLLPSLKPDFIKLDRSLVDGVSANPIKEAVVGRLIDLAHDLDVRVIAEGIEEPPDLAWLQQHNADFVQGYLLGRPGPDPTVTGVG